MLMRDSLYSYNIHFTERQYMMSCNTMIKHFNEEPRRSHVDCVSLTLAKCWLNIETRGIAKVESYQRSETISVDLQINFNVFRCIFSSIVEVLSCSHAANWKRTWAWTSRKVLNPERKCCDDRKFLNFDLQFSFRQRRFSIYRNRKNAVKQQKHYQIDHNTKVELWSLHDQSQNCRISSLFQAQECHCWVTKKLFVLFSFLHTTVEGLVKVTQRDLDIHPIIDAVWIYHSWHQWNLIRHNVLTFLSSTWSILRA